MDATQVDVTQTNEEDLYATYSVNKPTPRKSQKFRDEGTDNATARTYATNETGHVDLVGHLEGEDITLGEEPDEEGSADELALQDTQGTVTLTSPSRFEPVTPGFAIRRIASPTLPERTPLQNLAAFFNIKPSERLLRPSQLFAQTQATGSPPQTVVRSDPIYGRPSPDFGDGHRSSQAAPLSSPVMFRGSGRRAATEPRDDYVSLRESQERRALQVDDNDMSSSASDGEDELDEDSAQRRAQRRRDRVRLKERALSDLAGILPPISPRKTNVRRRLPLAKSSDGLKTPAQRIQNSEVIITSDNPPEQDGSDVESVDEYDELSQQIVPIGKLGASGIRKTQSGTHLRFDDVRVSHSPAASDAELDEDEDELDVPDFTYANQNKLESQAPARYNTETVAVANSQPERGSAISSLPSRIVLPSSIDSRQFVSQSQDVSGASKPAQCEVTTLTNLKSSSLPQPPAQDSSGLPSIKDIRAKEADVMDIDSSPPIQDRQDVVDGKSNESHVNDTHAGHHLSQLTSRDGEVFDAPMSSNNAPSSIRRSTTAYKPRPPRRRITYSVPDSSPSITPKLSQAAIITRTTVVESNKAPPMDPRLGVLSLSQVNQNIATAESNSRHVFATARTHQSASPQKVQLPGPQESPNGPQFSRMGDIAGSFRSTDPADNVEVNFNLMDDDDLEVAAALSSPPKPRKKRRTLTYGSSLHEASKKDVVEVKRAPPTPPRRTTRKDAPVSSPRRARIESPKNTSQTVDNSRVATVVAAAPSPLDTSPRTARAIRVLRREIAETPQAMLPKIVKPLKAVPTPNPPVLAGKLSATKSHKAPRKEVAKPLVELDIPEGSETPARIEEDIVKTCAPRRVLARFMGSKMAFYPATCLGFSSTSTTALRVRFDDGAEADVLSHLVKALDLRVDDLVKVDLANMRKETYIVYGFKNRLQSDLLDKTKYPKTDVRGYETVLLAVRPRASLPALPSSEVPEVVEVPIASIYVTNSMWIRFTDRVYAHPTKASTNGRPQTPVGGISTPSTPSSRSRRTALTNPPVPEKKVAIEAKSSLFDNMAFAVTYSSNRDNEKSLIARLIQEHGGRILADGYDELFIFSASTTASPSTSPSAANDPVFSLTTTAAELGFTALIADTHSRRAKYIQALALNIPCLSGKWILDSCRQRTVLPWDRYLLPAGESSHLDNAVRSRTFPSTQTYNALDHGAQLRHSVSHRPKLLESKSVMLVMGKGKAEERRKAYVFLTYALGAKRVARVRDLAAAKRMLEEENHGWDWVYVDDGKVDEARAELLGEKKVGTVRLKGVKRKRTGASEVDAERIGGGLKVVGDEFVVQSLIFGALVEQ